MKQLLLASLFLFSVSLFAQATVNFETNGNNWEWILFQSDKATFDVVANPSVGGLNTTDSCAMLQITDITADPWSGVFSTDFPDFTIDASNCYVRILVYKDHISGVGLKLEPALGPDFVIPNTVINQWEEILFDYSPYIGSSANTISIIPDFSANPRTYTSTSYFDEVRFTQQIVPVELTSFTGAFVGKDVQLKWATATEMNNRGFEIQRSINGSAFATVAFIEGLGTTTEQKQYTYIDQNIESRVNYSYRLKQIDFNGAFEYSSVINLGSTLPVEFVLDQNYPNPFNPSTTISFALPVKSNVTLNVYNLVGQKVMTIVNGNLEEGTHKYNIDASNLSSGIYIYSLSAAGENGNSSVITKKMTLLK